MALLPKIGNGALVGPEQILLMHKPNQVKRRQTFAENSNSQNENPEYLVLKKKKKNTSVDWWKDPAEVAMGVERRTKRRRKIADEKSSEDVANRIQRMQGPNRTSTKLDLETDGKDQPPVQTGRGHTNGYMETDRRVRFENTSTSSGENCKTPVPSPMVKGNSKNSITPNTYLTGKVQTTTTPNSHHTGKVHTAIQNELKRTDHTGRSENDDVTVFADQTAQQSAHRSVQARVRAARERAKIWAETCSDPGQGNNNNNNNIQIKAIHNDAVLKGRPREPRRGRTFNEIATPKQVHEPADAHVTGHKVAPERGKRLPPGKKEVNVPGPDQRSVNSAPAKEQPLMNGPVPKVNTIVSGNAELEKQSPRKDAVVQPKQERQPGPIENSPKPTPKPEKHDERPKPAEDVPKPPAKLEIAKPKAEKSNRKIEDQVEHMEGHSAEPKAESRAEPKAESKAEHKEEEKRERKHHKLPPDDHGPVNQPKPKLVSPPPPKPEPQDDDEDFKYYASMKPPGENQEHSTPRVPPLNIQSEKIDKSVAAQNAPKTKPRSRSISPSKSQRSKTVVLSKSPSTELVEQAKKRREVTIIDSRNLPKGEREPFMDEFEYGHERHKKFDEMDDEEKIDYFRNTLKLRPEQIRELTFHPKVNEPKVIHSTYTGTDAVNWKSPNSARGKSARRPKSIATKVYKKVQTVEPYKRKSFMLSRLQGVIYRHINNVYGNTPRNNREKQFFQKLAQIQMDNYRHRYSQLADNERKWLESTYRQKQQLHTVRKKFEDDAWRRFMTQYVTSKVLEAEYKDREEFGLPNNVSELGTRSPTRRMPMTLTPRRRSKVNQKRYGTMFQYNVGPQYKRKEEKLKFEGIDSVYVDTEDDQGKPAKRRQTVADIMREAKKILNQSDDSDIEESPPPPKTTKRQQQKPSRNYERKEGSERYERPHVHRSRDWRYSEGRSTPSHRSKSRSKSRSRPQPKTMKELLDRRQKESTQVNRYKASNFESLKKNLLKDSAMLDKSMKDKVGKTNEAMTDPIDQVAKSNDMSNNLERSVPESENNTTTEKTTEKVIHNGTDGNVSKASHGNTNGATDYLDHTETQMGIETAREEHEVQQHRKESPPKQKNEQQTPVPKPPKQRYTGEAEALNAEVASLTSQQKQNRENNRVQENRRESQASRVQSRISSDNKKTSETTSEAKISRAPSRVSLQSKQPKDLSTETQRPRAPSRVSIQSKQPRNIYVSTEKPRAPSRVSIQSKQLKDINTESQAPSRVSEAPSRTASQSLYDKYENKTALRRNSAVSQQSTGTRPLQNGRTSRASVAKTVNEETQMTNGTGRLSRTSNKINSRGSITPANSQAESKKHVHMNGDITESPNTKSPASQTSEKNVSPMLNGYSKSPRNSLNRETNEPVVKRNVHVSDVVNEIMITKNTNNRIGKPAAAKTSKSKQEGKTKASKHRVIRARSPIGHRDTKVDLDEYERRSQSRPARTRKRSSSRGRGRSTSKTRKRSVSRSRERKRSVSRERKASNSKQKSYSRFPDIDTSGRLSRLSNDSRTKRNVRVNVKEEVSERVITPAQKEPKQWKDLVQKYLRQPSPKVGKTDDRSLLETTLDTDEEDDEIDIFERAKKRYLLDSDQESI